MSYAGRNLYYQGYTVFPGQIVRTNKPKHLEYTCIDVYVCGVYVGCICVYACVCVSVCMYECVCVWCVCNVYV